MEAPQPQPYEDKCNKHLQQTFNKKWEETNMKKKVLSALLTTAMLASMLVGCGSSNDAPAAASSEAAPAASTEAATSTEVAEPAAEEGKVLNIYAWNEEFKSRLIAKRIIICFLSILHMSRTINLNDTFPVLLILLIK